MGQNPSTPLSLYGGLPRPPFCARRASPPAVRRGALQGALQRPARPAHGARPGPPRPGRGGAEVSRWQRPLLGLAARLQPGAAARHGGEEDEPAAGPRQPLLRQGRVHEGGWGQRGGSCGVRGVCSGVSSSIWHAEFGALCV